MFLRKKISLILVLIICTSLFFQSKYLNNSFTNDFSEKIQDDYLHSSVNSPFNKQDLKTKTTAPLPSQTELIVITNDTTAVESFASWKTQKGVPTYIASISSIKNNYTNGTLPERIHAFLRDAYTNWGNLTYVLLAGDDSHIPMMRVYLNDISEGWGLSATLKPTDFYYACLDDTNWDDDGDGTFGESSQYNLGGVPIGGPDEIDDWDPDVYVGRIPFADYSDIESFLELIMDYESDPLNQFQTSGWQEILSAGGIMNYDEQVNSWNDNNDPTDNAELVDYLLSNDIPSSYLAYNYYENRSYFWDYSPTHSFSNLSRENIVNGIDSNDPSLIHFTGHGSPTSLYRLLDSSGSPYGERQTVNSELSRITGIKVADADNQDGDDEIVAVTSGGAVNVYQGNWEDGWSVINIANLGNSPTCVDVGDCDNDGANEIAVGAGPVVYVYKFTVGLGWVVLDTTADNPASDDILCIYIGECEEYDPEFNNEIVVGDIQGQVTLYQWSGAQNNFLRCIIYLNVPADPHIFQNVDCIKADDFDLDGVREVIFGAQGFDDGVDGVFAIQGTFVTPQPGASWTLSDIWIFENDWALSLDSGDPDNDGTEVEVVVGTNNGVVQMFQNWTFVASPNPLAQSIIIDANAGSTVEGIAIGDVDENTPTYEVIAGTIGGVLRKYVGAAGGAFYVIDQNMGGSGVDSLAVGYIDDDSESTHQEIAVGTRGGAQFPIFAYQWPVPYPMSKFYNTTAAANAQNSIPALTFVDACSTAAIDYAADSLAEAMLKRAASIAYIGALRKTWYYYGAMNISLAPGNKGGSRAAAHHFWEAFFDPTNNYQLGSTFYSMLGTYYSTYDTNAAGYHDETWHRKNLLSYVLLGDPELDIYTENPDTFILNYNSQPNLGDHLTINVQNSTGSAIANAKVCVQGLSFYFVGETDANGNITIVLSEDKLFSGETLTLTVSKHNFVTKTQQIVIGGGIEISPGQLFYNAETATVDLYSITANSTQPSIGMIDDTEAIKHSYTIFSETTGNTTVVGDLEFDSQNNYWFKENISLPNLANGDYYFRCTFKTAQDPKTIGPKSKSFSLQHTIVVSTPTISYDPDSAEANITAIKAICTYSPIGEVNSSEAIVYRYEIFNINGTSSGIMGNLSLVNSFWEERNVDVSSLTVGEKYWVTAYFEVLGANGTSPASNSFRAGYVIIITSLEISYDNTNTLLDITNVTAVSQNPTYGELDNTEATEHYYSLYKANDEITAITDDLVWSGTSWEALDIDLSALEIGRYYALCTFENIDGYGRSKPSELFRIFDPNVAKITVSKPDIIYDSQNKLLSIANVSAICSNAEHGQLDDTEAIVHTYSIYSITDEVNPIIVGNLSYDQGLWSAQDIDVSTLDDGNYFVSCYFEDIDAVGTSDFSEIFIIGYFVITVSTPTISYDSEAQTLTISNVIAVCNNTQHGMLGPGDVECAMYTLYSNEGIKTGLTGNLTYNGVSWGASEISVNNLSAGSYYVVCYFRDSDAEGYSEVSMTFTIATAAAEESFLEKYWWILAIAGGVLLIIIIIIIIVIIVKRKRTETIDIR